MTKAQVGHAALDPTVGIVEALAEQPDDEARIKFLRAGVAHAQDQWEAANEQARRIAAKWDQVREQWEAKVAESKAIEQSANAALGALSRELKALEN